MNMAITSYKQSSLLSDLRLLLVDPDRTNRSILTGLIEDMKPGGFLAVKSLDDGRSALAARSKTYDVVLLAVKNPPTSGFHFLQEIRAGGLAKVARDSCVILVSQPPNRTMIDLAGVLDADGFLALPMSPAKVTTVISKALKRDWDVKDPDSYLSVKLPKPVKKKAPKKDTSPKAWVVWSQKEKEKTDLVKSLEAVLAAAENKEKVETTRIENVKTFWLKDLRSGMILAEDITGEEDELILASGTPLNDPLIEKIKKFSEIGLYRSFLKAGAAPA